VTSVFIWIFIVSQWKNHGLQFVLCLLLFPHAGSEFLASAAWFVFDFSSTSSVLSPFGSRVTINLGFGYRGKSDCYSVVRQVEGWSKLVALPPLEVSCAACSIWLPSPLSLSWSSAASQPLLFLTSVLLERGVRPVLRAVGLGQRVWHLCVLLWHDFDSVGPSLDLRECRSVLDPASSPVVLHRVFIRVQSLPKILVCCWSGQVFLCRALLPFVVLRFKLLVVAACLCFLSASRKFPSSKF
jgi:hypothetical protein